MFVFHFSSYVGTQPDHYVVSLSKALDLTCSSRFSHCWGLTYDGLVSSLGGSQILINLTVRKPQPAWWATWLEKGFSFMYFNPEIPDGQNQKHRTVSSILFGIMCYFWFVVIHSNLRYNALVQKIGNYARAPKLLFFLIFFAPCTIQPLIFMWPSSVASHRAAQVDSRPE